MFDALGPRSWARLLLVGVLAAAPVLIAGCSDSPENQPTSPTPPPTPAPTPPPPSPVPPAPRARFTRCLAFGDSMTSGVLSTIAAPLVYTAAAQESYPAVLQRLLQQRYRDQVVIVINEGRPGETAFQALLRLQDRLRVERPEVLLLMEGANDLFTCATLPASQRSACVNSAVQAYNRLAAEARYTQIPVLIASLPPQNPAGPRGIAAPLIGQYNLGVRDIVRGEGGNAVLVDVNASFAGNLTLIGPDGLHPNVQGYATIAQAFFETIVRTYQLPATALAAETSDIRHSALTSDSASP